MSRLPAHPLAELFPLIEGDDFLSFAEDIREHGVVERIELLDGQILDGRNRYNALVHLVESGEVLGDGWGHRAGEPLAEEHLAPDHQWFRKFNRNIDGDPLPWVLSKNLKRRHLNESQRAMVAAKLANMCVGRPAKVGNEPVPPHIPSIDGISARAAAAMMNVGSASVERARAVIRDSGPELQNAVEQGRVSVNAAQALAELPESDQADVVARGEREILEVAKGIRARHRQTRFAEVNQKLADISRGNRDLVVGQRFPIIYADPATRFLSGFGDRSIENHYPTMKWDEIRRLPIGQLASDTALLLCWSTVPQLANTLQAISEWGFAYVSEWCWDKVDQGMGYWAFNQHEVLLIATRGSFPAPLPGTQPRSVYREKKTEHSAKPAWFAEQIERIWPDLPKVELFARDPRPGWAVWGNQAGKPGNIDAAAVAAEVLRQEAQEIPHEASGTAREAPSTDSGDDVLTSSGTQSAPPFPFTDRSIATEAATADVPTPADAVIDLPSFLSPREAAPAES